MTKLQNRIAKLEADAGKTDDPPNAASVAFIYGCADEAAMRAAKSDLAHPERRTFAAFFDLFSRIRNRWGSQ